jgi:riboflavin synthase
MFTGIIKEIGSIASIQKKGGGITMTINAPKCAAELSVDDSVSVNGVCQTVIAKKEKAFNVEAVEETLRKTTLGSFNKGTPVNLELPLRLNDRLGGHLILGHVDTIGTIESIKKRESSWWISVRIPKEFTRYVIPVGSIAIDGVSLTLAEVGETLITVSIIPHTMENTIFHTYKKETKVNLEFDLIGKYIERLLPSRSKKGITIRTLRNLGYEA